MQTLRLLINTQTLDIPIFVGSNLWDDIKNHLKKHFSTYSIFVISDSIVAELHSQKIQSELKTIQGFRGILTFPAGEQSKNRQAKENLENQLLKQKAGRDTVLIAIGGGVTGDLAGFVAATLHRGVSLIHVPTSLLAQVDSSIGGKVGINHSMGKNLIGAFYQPNAIFIDINFLQTLPQEEFINGMAEVIKYGVTLDEDLWDLVDRESRRILERDSIILEKLIERCIQLKIKVVEHDEKEIAFRSILNFGHTIGHAIEKLSNYEIKHGQAISFGMKIAVRLSQKLCGFPMEQIERLEKTLDLYGLNFSFQNDFPINEVWETIIRDKKTRQKIPHFTLLKNTLQAELFYPVQKETLEYVYNHS